MGWFTGLVLYALIWWVVLFAVLPIGVRSEAEADVAHGWHGAPANPRMGRKVVITSCVAVLVWLGCFAVIRSPYLNFRKGWLAITDPQ